MEPHQQRVITEHMGLSERIEALRRFKKTATFTGLPHADRELLERQCESMVVYQAILSERITRFQQT